MILQTIHKYKRTLFGVIFVLLLAVAMSGFGVNMLQNYSRTSQATAIRVGDREVTFDDVARVKAGSRLSGQQLADRLVGAAALDNMASEMGFRAGDDAIKIKLESELFKGAFNREQYAAFLRQMRMNAGQFEKTLHEEAVRGQLVQLLQDFSPPTDREARRILARQESKFNVDYLSIDPAKFLDRTSTPSDEQLQKYYDEHPSEFEVPAAVAYDYVLFKPENFEDKVEISAEDIELYYSDNEREFLVPEAAKVRRIQIKLPANASEDQRKETKEKANQVLSRAKAGESFEALVLEFSDDALTKTKGGDLGWLEKGKMAPKLEAAVLKLKGSGIADLVESDEGFEIAKVDEYRAQSSKPLDAVREDIKKKLAKEEAPAYAATRARDLIAEWKKSTIPLSEFALKNGLTVASTNGLLESGRDPEDSAKGLTDAILSEGADEKQLADIGKFSVIVAVTQFREADISAFSQVKSKIIETSKKKEAREIAQKTAQDLIEKLRSNNGSVTKEVATEAKADFNSIKDAAVYGNDSALFKNEDLARKIFSTGKSDSKPLGVYEIEGKFVIPAVTAIVQPAEKDMAEKLVYFKMFSGSQAADELLRSVINKEKSKSEIFVNPQVLAEG